MYGLKSVIVFFFNLRPQTTILLKYTTKIGKTDCIQLMVVGPLWSKTVFA